MCNKMPPIVVDYTRHGQRYLECPDVELAMLMLAWADWTLTQPNTQIYSFGELVYKHDIAHETIEQYEDQLVEYRI